MVLLDSADSAAVAVAVPVVPEAVVVPVVPVPVRREPELPAPAPPDVVQVPPEPLLRLLSLRLPQVAVESEVRPRLQGRQSFSAAMAGSSPPTGKPTYERGPSTR